MLAKTSAAAAIVLIASSASASDDSPGYAIALAASAVHASIAVCPKNIWTKEDEGNLIHKAAQELGAPSDAAIEKITSEVADKMMRKYKASNSLPQFCDMMFAEKVKMLTGKDEEAQ